jgi:Zn-finger nucleic acid-binding protein
MLCPQCRQAMIIVEHHHIEIDYCPRCEGVWFDVSELELLMQSANLPEADFSPEAMLLQPEVKETPHGRKCPICRRKMRGVAVGEPAIVIDVCTQGDGLWFDGGEVHQLLTQLASKTLPSKGASQEVLAFLGDTFKAKKK